MSQKTKIIVLHMKEVIYTAIFILFALILFILLLVMFHPGKKETTASVSARIYQPGTYSSPLILGGQSVNVNVTVDEQQITSISFSQMKESIETMYPLMNSSLEELKSQILKKQSTEGITYQQENQYTSQMLLHAIEDALKKAQITNENP